MTMKTKEYLERMEAEKRAKETEKRKAKKKEKEVGKDASTH
jgi:hypothetical protein